MILSLFLGLFIGAAAVVFALQNVFPVTVTFLNWEMTSSLAVLIILAMLAGFLISILMTIPGALKNYFTISELKRENRKLNKEVITAKKADEDVVVITEIPSKEMD